MNNKLFVRLICALLSVLTLVAIIPATAILAAAEDAADSTTDTTVVEETPHKMYTNGEYTSAEDYFLHGMEPYYSNSDYSLRCDEAMGIVAYRNEKTGEIMFTNPWNMDDEINPSKFYPESETKLSSTAASEREKVMSQILITYSGPGGSNLSFNSYANAAQKGQIIVVPIKNGVRVEYTIGDRSSRILAPELIEATTFEEKILNPLKEALIDEFGPDTGNWKYDKFAAYYNEVFFKDEEREVKREALQKAYPVLLKKELNMYALDDETTDYDKRNELEALIKKYCPDYTLEMMDEDHAFVEYEREDTSPPVFKLALEYVVDANGLSVTLPANGLRYDESVYRLKSLTVLPYMGSSLRANGGYSFVADGSGVLYELDSLTERPSNVYGDDYALQDEDKIKIKNHQIMRMPVYGQVEYTYADKEGNWISKSAYEQMTLAEQKQITTHQRGYLAIIEEGDALAAITAKHVDYVQNQAVSVDFVTRQSDTSSGGWSTYAKRRYVENYKIRYVMLTDETRAEQAGFTSFYECSWMGMACAYRDYLDSRDNGFERLTAADISETAIPLYIETFGCIDTVKKVLSMPVTVSAPLTTFEDVATMYEYLASKGVKNVNFKLKGYANGGMYSDVPYDLKWENSVGGKNGFKDLVAKAKANGFGIFPDFDFVYTTQVEGGDAVNMKKHAARTIDNRYTSKRTYSATYQTFVSHFQMVMAPAMYSRFYEKMGEAYAKYEATGISLSTFGSALNSDFDEEKTSLREESKNYTIQGLEYFKQNYDVMVDAGNAFTWSYVDHILGVPIDSSRYSAELSAVPFMSVVLHGYKQFASSPLNMEGNLSYAMLKAMESGASAYFILSYANTELLKEDEVLSQNYSVRYDIWQERLVELYHELNNVLADVQTKLIVKHELLNMSAEFKTVRVPDEDELLKDIEDIAEQKKQEILNKLDAERQAKLEAVRVARENVEKAVTDLGKNKTEIEKQLNNMLAQLGYKNLTSDLITAWITPLTPEVLGDAAKITALKNALVSKVIKPYVAVKVELQKAANSVLAAKAYYDYLKTNDVSVQVLDKAKSDLIAAIDAYVAVLNASDSIEYAVDTAARPDYIDGNANTLDALRAIITSSGTKVTVDDAKLEDFVRGTTEMAEHSTIGVDELYEAIVRALAKDGYYNPADAENSAINVAALLAAEEAGKFQTPTAPVITPPTASTSGSTGETAQTTASAADKYKVDNNVVAVTYAESMTASYYKTLLLNFNDYAIQTTYNGVTYTIAAYEYVVIKY